MLLQWGLILSVTLVSVTMLMIIGNYLAILPEAQQFYQTNRTMVLLLSNSFNIFYIIISPLLFNVFNKHYYPFVLFSTIATAVAAVGRYLAGTNYTFALLMTIVIAIAHIPIITAPYGLLKLFPNDQKGYAASIPLFLPVLGINFCILYGMSFISNDGQTNYTLEQIHANINQLNAIIAVVGIVASVSTVNLLILLKDKIVQDKSIQNSGSIQQLGSESFAKSVISYSKNHKLTIITLICWGGIVGINWTYGSLFGVIFDGQGLSGKNIALLGLAANLSSAIFSNLGTFIQNRYKLSTTRVIGYLNIFGFLAAILIQASKFLPFLQNLQILVFLIVVLRAGYSSFVSLAFMEMQKSNISSVIISGFFFWVANVVNLAGMEIVDLVNIDISMYFLTMTVAICIYFVSESYIKSRTGI